MIDNASTIATRVQEATRFDASAQRPASAPLFNGYMEKALSPTASQEKQLRHLAQMYVSNAMIMPMFEQMRNDPLAANLMHGGRGEKIFQQQMDQVLSDRIAASTRFGLVDAVYNQLSQQVTGKAVNANG